MRAGIVGAGIMGQLLALELINSGWDVTLFDPNSTNNCSMVAAGLLTPISELEKSDLVIFQLGIKAISQYWPEILAILPTRVFFRQMGSLVISHPHEHADLKRLIQIISSKLTTSNPNFYHEVSQEKILKLENDLDKFSHGYYFPQEGQVDSQSFLAILAEYLADKTLLIKSSVSNITSRKIVSQHKKYNFDLVFDCRGLGARTVFKNLRSIRGELIWLHAPDVVITRPVRFLHPRYSLYLVPRDNNIYLVGASEVESQDDSCISVRTTLELLTAAYYIQPKFAEARIIKTATQCRPTLNDHLPKIQHKDGVIAINGLYRHGFLIAPTLAKEIMKFIQHGYSALCHPQLWENAYDDYST